MLAVIVVAALLAVRGKKALASGSHALYCVRVEEDNREYATFASYFGSRKWLRYNSRTPSLWVLREDQLLYLMFKRCYRGDPEADHSTSSILLS